MADSDWAPLSSLRLAHFEKGGNTLGIRIKGESGNEYVITEDVREAAGVTAECLISANHVPVRGNHYFLRNKTLVYVLSEP